jgi:hypothetical protein
MTTIVEIILLAATLALVGAPLFARRFAAPAGAAMAEGELSELLYKKDAAYAALKDLEFDHRTGKIDDADYRAMKGQFESEAMAIIKTIDEFKTGYPEKSTGPTDAARFCAACGAKADAGHKFCGSCGAKL